MAWQDLVKGYEYEKGHFVVLTKEDFQAAALEKSRRIDVLDFVKAEDVDDRYFDKPYYLTAGKGGDTAYALLRETIRTSGRIAIGKFVMREVQHLAAVEVVGDALVLSTLRFATELVDVGTLRFPAAHKFRKQELDMAKALVGNLAADWDPEKYTDDYRENLMRVIRAKMKGKEAHLVAEAPERSAKVVDLMERLRQSLEETKPAKARGRTTRKAAGGRKKASRRRTAA